MIKAIGTALVGLAATLALAAPVQASTLTVDGAKATAEASAYVSVWHHAHHGYVMKTRDPNQPDLRIPNRPVTMRGCRGAIDGTACRASIVTYYGYLHHTWRTLNQSLWLLIRDLPLCATGLTDCVPPPMGPRPIAVYVDAVVYVAHQRGATTR